jgi:ADP-ribosylglycohydrolase
MSKTWLSLENKVRGLLIGIAVGDAKGTQTEFTFTKSISFSICI